MSGVPSSYNDERGDWVCSIISTSTVGLEHLHRNIPDFPDATTIYYWLAKIESFRPKYYKARELQANILAESTIDDALGVERYQDKEGVERIDAGILGQAKLLITTKMWHASKLQPKRWGDAKQIEAVVIERDKLKEELISLRHRLEAQEKREY